MTLCIFRPNERPWGKDIYIIIAADYDAAYTMLRDAEAKYGPDNLAIVDRGGWKLLESFPVPDQPARIVL